MFKGKEKKVQGIEKAYWKRERTPHYITENASKKTFTGKFL